MAVSRDRDGRGGRIVTFYSYTGGTGRTMALANTAWILAANGKRVLAVDWDLEAPGLHRFLHPFLAPAALGAGTGVIDLISEYAWAATSPVRRTADWHEDYARVQPHAVPLAPDAMGGQFPYGGALDFLPAGRQNREYAATVTTFDWDHFYDRLGGGLFFDALRADMKRNYDYVLIDSRTGLSDAAEICTVHLPDVLVACFTLSDQSIEGAAAVARQIDERFHDRGITLHPVPMRVDESDPDRADAGRARARTVFDGLPHAPAGDEPTSSWPAVEIPYRSAYAYEETLAAFGDEAGRTGSLLSAFERLTAVITDGAVTSLPAVDERTRRGIQDAFTRTPAPTAALPRSVERPTELAEARADSSGTGPRLPGSVPRIWNAPPRNPGFTGRATVLERLRERLGGGMAVVLPQPQTLFGLGGVGKTQVALEYAHRFTADYDLVWWISAEQTEDVVAGLAELAARLGVQTGQDMAAAAQEAVDLLRRGVPSSRWLLVFDNADDPETLHRFLPPGGPGHVLVTSRNQSWSQYAAALPVDVYLREESVEHLQRRAPGLGKDDAEQVAVAVGDLPLAVEQAGSWIAETATPAAAYVEQLAEQAASVLALNQPPGYPEPVAATWNISIERLRSRSPAAARLLQLCAFLAPEPISANLLYGKEMTDALAPYDSSLREHPGLGRVLREIGRFGLARIDQADDSIQVHRLVQAVIRARLTEEEQREARHAVHRILAGARPDEDEPIDNPETWPLFHAIWPHLAPSEARYCKDPQTRRLLLDRVRYLWKRGDSKAAHQLGEELLEAWREIPGSGDPQYLHLRFHLSNILRSQGRLAEAKEMDEVTLERRRAVLGPSHPDTYTTMSGLAHTLGALGRYAQAVELATDAHQGFGRILPEAHPRTLAAANDLALNLRAVGQYARAREIDQEVFDLRTQMLGPDHPYTLSSARHLARDLREAGRYEDSVQLLSRTYESYKRTRGKACPGTLSAAKSLAVSLRRAGWLEDALRLTTATRDRYRAARTPAGPDLLACELNLAADLFATGDPGGALDLAQEVVDAFARAPGERHPYTLAAVNNLAVFHCGTGDAGTAELLLRQTVRTLRDVLGDDHPHRLVAQLNLANALAGLGDPEGALELDRRAVTRLRETLGAHHPETLAAASNLAVSLDGTGRTEEAARLRAESVAELARLLGEDHGLTRAARGERRIHRDLEPVVV
ncbi:FxSxx-COOH system tetratricopeptide repeat protein [Streptomyces sp. NPDC048270]|uniref:FxSxx-COOH system tetratricopeptide repeat protein n=1 Tax=Streptomyces sp. NPDC048270 TaxID=3154615 RepID=UPI0033DE3BC0